MALTKNGWHLKRIGNDKRSLLNRLPLVDFKRPRVIPISILYNGNGNLNLLPSVHAWTWEGKF